ncbi:hypothetical protein B0F90DRAFT_1067293 [Multifurca ochricompacta]|uniref:Uncharacterized protein n=1 Tax=Multifurca ochricompacta TaxID=376703 RepID=A0AAD4M7Y9_9AGAM|nr:hypothetical protein B0F90DRAFT_1067293 [Multifurca ochricompacta]
MSKRRTRARHPIVRRVRPPTLPAKAHVHKADPIRAMLHERKKEMRSGGGIEAVNCAEGYDHNTLLSGFSIDEPDESVDGADPGRQGSVDENTTHCVAPVGRRSDDADIAPHVEDEVHQEERERLLGAKEGEAVGKILDADRKLERTTTRSVLGIAVFINDREGTSDTERGSMMRPIWESTKGKTATLSLLSVAIKQQDIEYMQAVFGVLSAEDMAVPGVAQWLCEQALWYGNEYIGRYSRKFLLEMPLWARSYPGSPLALDLIVYTLMRLGLCHSLSTHVRPIREAATPRLQNRPGVLGSLVKMVSSFAPRWTMEQLPDLIIVLLLIGLDMEASNDLRRDILPSVSLLCHRLSSDPEGEDTEISIATKVLNLAKSLSASNQALLLSFFTKASPNCLRIARAVAYHILTSSAIQPENYALPPLGLLITVLSDVDGLFSIADSTDYDALTSRITVLSVALSGIEDYVAEESMWKKIVQAPVPEGSPRKKGLPPLELIKARLDVMHGKIFDTRAAHLDRSRAKGAIQRLSMRVHYQRAALSKTSGQLRLGDFFNIGDNSRQPKRKNGL